MLKVQRGARGLTELLSGMNLQGVGALGFAWAGFKEIGLSKKWSVHDTWCHVLGKPYHLGPSFDSHPYLDVRCLCFSINPPRMLIPVDFHMFDMFGIGWRSHQPIIPELDWRKNWKTPGTLTFSDQIYGAQHVPLQRSIGILMCANLAEVQPRHKDLTIDDD
jgi:hypothetical protein